MRDVKTVLLSLIVAVNDGGYLARRPGIRGAFAEGDTIEEAIFNCLDVVKMIAEYRAERGESLAAQVLEITPPSRALLTPLAIRDGQGCFVGTAICDPGTEEIVHTAVTSHDLAEKAGIPLDEARRITMNRAGNSFYLKACSQ